MAAHTALCRKAAFCCAATAGHAPQRGRAAEGRRAVRNLGWRKTLQGRGTVRGRAGAEAVMLPMLRVLADASACGSHSSDLAAGRSEVGGVDTYCFRWSGGGGMHDQIGRTLYCERIMQVPVTMHSDERGRRRWHRGAAENSTVCMLWLIVRNMAAILLRM